MENRSYRRIWATTATRAVLFQKYSISINYVGGGESMIECPTGYSIVVPKGHDKSYVFLITDQTDNPVADAIWNDTLNAFILTINNGQTIG